MPNSVKYNTESEANALTIGNMHIGAGDIPKGPTSSTGFYNGINPPNGGYTIYIHKNTEGSSILLPTNDAELIVMTNQIAGASYTTINECFNYFAGQSGKFVIHNPIPPFITSDLRFSIDSRILPSYPRNGSTLYDLSGYNNNWTPLTNVVFNGQSFEFNGTTSYMQDTVSSFNPDSAPNVMEVLFKPMDLGSRQQAIFSDNWGPEYGIWINSSNNLQGAAYTSVNTSNIQVGRWYYAVLNVQPGATRSSTDQTYLQFYVNGQFIGENNSNTGNGMNDQPFSLGFDYKSNNPAAFFSGSIALARLSYGQYNQADVNFNYYGGNIITDDLVLALDAGNLVSYESGSTTAYSMTGSLSGSLVNGVGFSNGNGGIWEFDGIDDYIAIDNLGLSSNTIEGWFNSNDGSQGGAGYATICSIFGNYDGGASKYTYIGLIPNLTFRIDDGASSHAGIATVSYTANTWYYVALTYDATSGVAKAYVNGDEIGSRNSTTNITFNSIPHNIAKTQVNVYFDGEVASHKTYNRALTADEVSQNYRANINRFN